MRRRCGRQRSVSDFCRDQKVLRACLHVYETICPNNKLTPTSPQAPTPITLQGNCGFNTSWVLILSFFFGYTAHSKVQKSHNPSLHQTSDENVKEYSFFLFRHRLTVYLAHLMVNVKLDSGTGSVYCYRLIIGNPGKTTNNMTQFVFNWNFPFTNCN